jgi:rifampin ADP-ribosylating transferase
VKEAGNLFVQAWNEATDDFKKYLAAYCLARSKQMSSAKLKWFETALELALRVDDHSTNSALPSIYSNLARCYESLNDFERAKKYSELAISAKNNPSDKGPFYHGTKADLKTGDLLTARIPFQLPFDGSHESHLFHGFGQRSGTCRRTGIGRWTSAHLCCRTDRQL